jgi:predicted RNA-binding Zn ribbon-like protein
MAAERDAVPAPARLLRDFVNSAEPQTGSETFDSPAALSDWCREHGLLPAGAVLTRADLTAAVTVREGLRAVLHAHAGHRTPADGLSAFDAALERVPLRAFFDDAGTLRLRAGDDRPLAGVVAGMLDAVRAAGTDGSWDRLKVCARDSCRWSFYDTSRNRSGRWCSMAGCGNQVKMRRAHARRRAGAGAGLVAAADHAGRRDAR